MVSAIDLVGQRYGKLTVMQRSGSVRDGRAAWLCQCDCGNQIVVAGVDLRTSTKSCGCLQTQVIDETGNRYGRLTVIDRAIANPGLNGATWICRCECGKEAIVLGSSLRNGSITGCGCLHPRPKGEAAFNAYYSRVRHRAKSRGFDFDLTKEQVWDMCQQPCSYCGCEPSQELRVVKGNGSLIYNGIDRVDTSKGYVRDNVVSCCGHCNQAKALLSVDEFRTLVCCIYRNWASKEER